MMTLQTTAEVYAGMTIADAWFDVKTSLWRISDKSYRALSVDRQSCRHHIHINDNCYDLGYPIGIILP